MYNVYFKNGNSSRIICVSGKSCTFTNCEHNFHCVLKGDPRPFFFGWKGGGGAVAFVQTLHVSLSGSEHRLNSSLFVLFHGEQRQHCIVKLLIRKLELNTKKEGFMKSRFSRYLTNLFYF